MHNIKIGDKDVKFVRSRGEVVYPNYVKDGLVLWYDFSGMENSGVKRGVAEDLSGNGNAGVLENFAFDEGSGYVDNGLEFDGVDDYVVCTNNESISAIEDLTIQVTVKGDYSGISRVVSRHYINYAVGFRMGRRVNFESSGGNIYSNSILENGNIYSIAITYNNTYSISKIWINGLLDSTHNVSYNINNGIQDLFIGALNTNNQMFPGNIYSTRIYNRALTPEEVAHNYKIDKHRFNIQD